MVENAYIHTCIHTKICHIRIFKKGRKKKEKEKYKERKKKERMEGKKEKRKEESTKKGRPDSTL